jgi:hypothetical protein
VPIEVPEALMAVGHRNSHAIRKLLPVEEEQEIFLKVRDRKIRRERKQKDRRENYPARARAWLAAGNFTRKSFSKLIQGVQVAVRKITKEEMPELFRTIRNFKFEEEDEEEK